MGTLKDAIEEIQTDVVTNLTGIHTAPTRPDINIELPMVVAFPAAGNYSLNTPQDVKGLHDIRVELHVKYGNSLPAAYDQSMRFAESLPNLFFSAVLNDRYTTIETFREIDYEYLPMTWGGKSTLGWRLFIRGVKIRFDVT